jgi:NTE family protein
MVDTEPLRSYLKDTLHAVDGELTGIRYNIETGRIKAAAISTSSYTSGQSTTWVQGRDIQTWERPHRRARQTVLTIEHVMASTAIPLFFPAVMLEDGWHGDGSIRLTAPLSPALHLGARRIIAISTRYARTEAEADRREVEGYPPAAQVAGVLMNSVFLDLLDNDAMELQRLNAAERAPPGPPPRAPSAAPVGSAPLGRSGASGLRLRAPAAEELPLPHARARHARHQHPRPALLHPLPAGLPARAHGHR